MSTAIVGNGSPGAGRFIDLLWPNNYSNTNGVERIGNGSGNNIMSVSGAPGNQGIYKGRWSLPFTMSAVTAIAMAMSGYRIFPPVERGSGNLFGIDDTMCFRIIAIQAFTGAVVAVNQLMDVGLQVVPGIGVSGMVKDGWNGMGFFYTGPNVVRYRVRKAVGTAYDYDAAIPNIVTADWNAYEIRYIGPTDKVDGVMKAYVNGVLVAAHSYGAGTILPQPVTTAPNYGFLPVVWNGINGAATAPLAQIRVIVGPTESSLL